MLLKADKKAMYIPECGINVVFLKIDYITMEVIDPLSNSKLSKLQFPCFVFMMQIEFTVAHLRVFLRSRELRAWSDH